MSEKFCDSVDFKKFFESSPGLYLVLTPQLKIVAVSNAYLQATLTQRESILGKNIFVVFPDNSNNSESNGTTVLRASLERVLRNKIPDTMEVQKYQIKLPDAAGGGFGVKYWSLYNSPVLNDFGQVEYIIHRIEDVTDFVLFRKEGQANEKHFELELFQRAQELQITNQSLRTAEKLKAEFLATMSHEIRTHMNGILGMIELILKSSLNQEQRSCAQIIHDSTLNLMTIINDILDISKIEAGKIELETIDFSLIQVVESQVKMLEANYKLKGLSFTTAIDPKVPDCLKGDPRRIGQVLLNLVSNAIKFTQNGSIFVEVTKQTMPPERIKFSVTDTGIGIASKIIPQLFNPYVQADSSTTRKFGGTGLGLSISKSLVTLMNGEMGVDSVEGKGSCFWFTLPLKNGEPTNPNFSYHYGNRIDLEHQTTNEVPASRKARKKNTQQTSECQTSTSVLSTLDSSSDVCNGHVLVVEDFPVNQKVAKSMLEKAGYKVTVATNGKAALETLHLVDFDLILMDCQMPVMDGFEATKMIRQMPDFKKSQIPIIAVTANAMKGDDKKCIHFGMNDYISKPLQNEILISKVNHWLRLTLANSAK